MSKLTPIQQAFFNEVVFYGKRRTKPLEAYMLSVQARVFAGCRELRHLPFKSFPLMMSQMLGVSEGKWDNFIRIPAREAADILDYGPEYLFPDATEVNEYAEKVVEHLGNTRLFPLEVLAKVSEISISRKISHHAIGRLVWAIRNPDAGAAIVKFCPHMYL